MSRTEVIDKARDLIAPVLGGPAAGRLIEAVYSIETMANVRALGPLLQRSDAGLEARGWGLEPVFL